MIGWNKVYYVDCLDRDNGLPYLLRLIHDGMMDKIDLCITDPPYNIDFKGIIWESMEGNNKLRNKKVYYPDSMSPEEYKQWCYEWFDLLKEICTTIVFTPGYKNRQMWMKKENFDFLYWNNMYMRGSSRICRYKKIELILVYGDLPVQTFEMDLLKYNFAFNNKFDYKELIHPSPKPRRLYEWFIETIKPTTVIDPFLGSGTTAEVCTMKEINWIGYEKYKPYKKDINKRLTTIEKEIGQEAIF